VPRALSASARLRSARHRLPASRLPHSGASSGGGVGGAAPRRDGCLDDAVIVAIVARWVMVLSQGVRSIQYIVHGRQCRGSNQHDGTGGAVAFRAGSGARSCRNGPRGRYRRGGDRCRHHHRGGWRRVYQGQPCNFPVSQYINNNTAHPYWASSQARCASGGGSRSRRRYTIGKRVRPAEQDAVVQLPTCDAIKQQRFASPGRRR